MDLRLRNSAVLLVGGTRGIGREVARLLGQEGARVALVARDPAALDATANEVRDRGGQAVVIPTDVVDPAQAARAVQQAAQTLGTFDALIHAAGRGIRGAFLALDDAAWQEAFDVNLFAPVRMARLAIPHMAKAGRIVLLGAASARHPHFRQAPSNAAKAALANLTATLAHELAPDLIVNCVAPGKILTDRRRDRLAAEARSAGTTLEERLRQDAADVLLRRHGDPSDVAAVVVFFASPWASYTTGQSIIVDGGWARGM
jgi:3-oxoacyl-[acyl-carrier protein] reductase